MNRFHVHVAVSDLDQSIQFYSRLFAAPPSVVEADYAKWMLEDPRVNFAISCRKCGNRTGVNHLGLQVDSDDELTALEARFTGAGLTAVAEREASCCYARSDKSWVQDPDGIAWEHFHTRDRIPVFGGRGPELLRGEPQVGADRHDTAAAKSACCG